MIYSWINYGMGLKHRVSVVFQSHSVITSRTVTWTLELTPSPWRWCWCWSRPSSWRRTAGPGSHCRWWWLGRGCPRRTSARCRWTWGWARGRTRRSGRTQRRWRRHARTPGRRSSRIWIGGITGCRFICSYWISYENVTWGCIPEHSLRGCFKTLRMFLCGC